MTGVELAAVPLGLNGPAKGRRGQNSVGLVKEGDTVGKESLLNCKLQKFSLHTHKHLLQIFLIPELLRW